MQVDLPSPTSPAQQVDLPSPTSPAKQLDTPTPNTVIITTTHESVKEPEATPPVAPRKFTWTLIKRLKAQEDENVDLVRLDTGERAVVKQTGLEAWIHSIIAQDPVASVHPSLIHTHPDWVYRQRDGYVVLEVLEYDLHDMVTTTELATVPVLATLFADALQGLVMLYKCSHRIHADVAPVNICVRKPTATTERLHGVLMDFGLTLYLLRPRPRPTWAWSSFPPSRMSFMSTAQHERSHNQAFPHVVDDLEALLYTFMWSTTGTLPWDEDAQRTRPYVYLVYCLDSEATRAEGEEAELRLTELEDIISTKKRLWATTAVAGTPYPASFMVVGSPALSVAVGTMLQALWAFPRATKGHSMDCEQLCSLIDEVGVLFGKKVAGEQCPTTPTQVSIEV